jgi:hypothetical protein
MQYAQQRLHVSEITGAMLIIPPPGSGNGALIVILMPLQCRLFGIYSYRIGIVVAMVEWLAKR